MGKIVKGYKVFNENWTCRGFQYAVGKTYEMKDNPVCCEKGFHFCLKASDCFSYYPFCPEKKVTEVEALGKVDVETHDSKCCTNKIKIVRELSWHEVLDIVNNGKGCTGFGNSGDRNSGDYNSGDRNSGDYNSGNRNSGDKNCGYRNSGFGNSGSGNSGDFNSGDRNIGERNRGNLNSGDFNSGNGNNGDKNSGNCNTGDFNSGAYNSGIGNSGNFNSGNFNSGDRNSGCFNKTNFSSGCFNTEEAKILMFNQPSDWTLKDWYNSEAYSLLEEITNVFEWVFSEDMSDEEKIAHPEHKTTGGYLKKLDKAECGQIKWWNLTAGERDIIRSLPNFDKNIFKEITGIDVVRQEEAKNE